MNNIQDNQTQKQNQDLDAFKENVRSQDQHPQEDDQMEDLNEQKVTLYKEEESRSKNNLSQMSKEQKNQTQTKNSNSSSVNEYEFTVINYKYFEELLKFVENDKFKQTIKSMKFNAYLSDTLAQKFYSIRTNKYENDQIQLQKVNKDLSKSLEFTPENEPVMSYYINQHIKPKKMQGLIEYEKNSNTINIKNSKMDSTDFKDFFNKLNQEKDEIKVKQLPLIDIFSQQQDIFSNQKNQLFFLKSEYVSHIQKDENITTIILRSRNVNLDLSFSIHSESESESEQRSETLFNEQSIFHIYGFDEEKIRRAVERLKKYSQQPINLDFSQLGQRAIGKKPLINEDIIKGKIDLFVKSIEPQFKEYLQQLSQEKGLSGEYENRTQSQVRYRLQGNRDDISNVERYIQEKIQQIQGELFEIQACDDQFLEKHINQRFEEEFSKINQNSQKFLVQKYEKEKYIIFIYIESGEEIERKKIQEIKTNLDTIVNLKRQRLEKNVCYHLYPKFEDFKQHIFNKREEYCKFEEQKIGIYLIGTINKIQNTKEAINKYIQNNVQKEFCLKNWDPLFKNIFKRYYLEDFKKQFPDFSISPEDFKKADQLLYQIPQFHQENAEKSLINIIEQIRKEIQKQSIPCTRHQFQILQNDLPFLQKIQEDLAVEIISDPKKLNELGHPVQQLEMSANLYKQYIAFSSDVTELKIALIHADIQSVPLDALMLNIQLDGKYIDNLSSEIIQLTGCGKYTVENINQINSGQSKFILDYNDDDDNLSNQLQIEEQKYNQGYNNNTSSKHYIKKNKNLKNRFQYFSTSLLNTSFPTQQISMAVLKNDSSNVKKLLKMFLQEHEDKLNLGIIIPNSERLEENYLSSFRELLLEKYKQPAQNSQIRHKNIFLFCEKKQLESITQSLITKKEKQIYLSLNSQKESLFTQSNKEYLLEDNQKVPHEFELLLDSFNTGKNRNKERFYAFLPKRGIQYEKLQIRIPPQNDDRSIVKIILNNIPYNLEDYLQQQDQQYVEEIKKAVKKCKEQNIDSLYIYEDSENELQCDFVRVSVNKRKIRYMRSKKYIEYKEIVKEKDEKKNFIYVLRGKGDNDIKEAQNRLNSELFINQNKELWDFSYVDESQPKLTKISQENHESVHIQIYKKYEKLFRKQQLQITELYFIQNIPLSYKFQDQVTFLHNKCKETPIIYQDMFYCQKDYSTLEEIFTCNTIGFDPRVHSNIFSQNCILLQNKPCQDDSYEYTLICEVVAGKQLKQDFGLENLKRLPKDKKDNQFYDSIYIDEQEDFSIGIFDYYRIYPIYLAKYTKLIESETNYTTDDYSRQNIKMH